MTTDRALDSIETVLDRTFRGRRVLITGHSGFVGSWLSQVLIDAGAQVHGMSLPVEPGSLAAQLRLQEVPGAPTDIRSLAPVERAVEAAEPEIVFHLAAQALVLPSYRAPVDTFAVNVLGTAHVLEALRTKSRARACVVVTSDKCYATAPDPHVETDPLGGEDPYSASKSAAEMIAHSFALSFEKMPPIATARAGNIVGGGDMAADRIVPDLVRAIAQGEPLRLRRPDAVRPWQHVIEAVAGYLRLGDKLVHQPAEGIGAWNFGPPSSASSTVAEFIDRFIAGWRRRGITVADPILESAELAEREMLLLDSSKSEQLLGWRSALDLNRTVDLTVDWYVAAARGESFDARAITSQQWSEYSIETRASKETLSPDES